MINGVIKKKLFFVIVMIFISLFSIGAYAQKIPIDTSIDEECGLYICTRTLYSYAKYHQNSTGQWVEFSDVLSITKNSDDITFHYDGITGYFNITFEAGAMYNGNYYSMYDIKQLRPEIEFDFPTWKNDAYRKYAVNISNIPDNIKNNISSITLTYKSHYGFTVDKLKSEAGRFIIKELMALYFDDLIDKFNFNINVAQRRIYINNISSNIIDGNLYLDPTVSLQTAESENLEDTFANETAAGSYIRVNGNQTYIKWNITSLQSTNIESAYLHYSQASTSCSFPAPGNIYWYHVYNQTWSEDTLTTTDQPCGQNHNESTQCNMTYESYVGSAGQDNSFTVKNMLQKDITDGKSNFSVVWLVTSGFGCSIDFRSKEAGEYTPILAVVYTVTPYIKNVSISPTKTEGTCLRVSNDTVPLNCSSEYYAADNGRLEFIWYKSNSSGSYLMDYNGSTTDIMVSGNTGYTNVSVPISALLTGNKWICSVRAWNTTHYSVWANYTSPDDWGGYGCSLFDGGYDYVKIISYPQWYVNISSNPSEYNPNIMSLFNITMNTSTNSTDKVFFETNCTNSGTAINYTMTNQTYGGSIYNYSSILPSCNNAYFKIYANTTEVEDNNAYVNSYYGGHFIGYWVGWYTYNRWNTSDTWNFTINKNSSNPFHLNMTKDVFVTNSTDANITVMTSETVNVDCWMSYSNSGTCDIYVDSSLITLPYNNTFGVGAHSVKVNTSGNANYTSNATGVTYYIIAYAPGSGGGGGGALPELLTPTKCFTDVECQTKLNRTDAFCYQGICSLPLYCGDGICSQGETEMSCSLDCKPKELGIVASVELIIIIAAGAYVFFTQTKFSSKRKEWEI